MYAYIHNYLIHQDHRTYLRHPDHQHYQLVPYFFRLGQEASEGSLPPRIISTISQYLISSGLARRPLRAPGRQGPKNGHFTIGRQ